MRCAGSDRPRLNRAALSSPPVSERSQYHADAGQAATTAGSSGSYPSAAMAARSTSSMDGSDVAAGGPVPSALFVSTRHNATVAKNQLDAVGIVVAQVNDEWDAQGSCFLFRSDALALTAAHCVPEALEPFAVQLPHLGTTMPVERIERHPAADIAMLFCTARTP
jgi:hypothetical protein